MTRRTTRLLCALALTGAAVPLLGITPAAAATSEAPSSAGYFSTTGPFDTGTPAGTLPNVGTSVDGVAEGNLAVAGGSGQEQKVSFLMFPGAELVLGARVSSATLSVPLAEGDGNVSASAFPEKVRACAVDDTGFGGEDGVALSVAPARLCDEFAAPGKASPDGSAYVFDVTGLAQRWTEANDGLALTVAEGADTTVFQVVFAPEAVLAYEATPPADDVTGVTSPALPVTPPVTGGSGSAPGPAIAPDSGFGGFDAGASASSGQVSLTAPLTAPLDASAGPVDEPVVLQEAPLAAPQQVSPVAVRTLADGSLTPGAGFWVALLLLGAVLALVSLVVGDTAVARRARSSTLLSRALQQRQDAPEGAPRPAGRRTVALG